VSIRGKLFVFYFSFSDLRSSALISGKGFAISLYAERRTLYAYLMRSPSFCGVILAAGASTRMGRDKALLPWPPEIAAARPAVHPGGSANDWFTTTAPAGITGTFLSAQIKLLQPSSEMVIVVAGANAAALSPVVYALGAYLVENPAPERGQFSSLRIGVQEVLNRGRDAAIITLVDRPPASTATVQNVRDTFLASDSANIWAAVPEHAGRHGHPIVVGREMITAFLRAPETATARDVEHAAQPHILYVPVDDPNIAININTPEEYAALRG
jgi:molybdenum cofactor cytidylyltransferase